jgi:hypothetical protein
MADQSNAFRGIVIPCCPICKRAEEFIKWTDERKKYAITTNGHLVSYCRNEPYIMSTNGKHEYCRGRKGTEENAVVVHKTVATAFPHKIPGWDGSPIDWTKWEIDHHDKNKKHNCVSNLRVVPKGSQVFLTYAKGERKRKLTPQQIQRIRNARRRGVPVKILARVYKVSKTRIYQVAPNCLIQL